MVRRVAKIAIVAVPFILADRHIRLADQMVRSIVSNHEITRIAIVNNARSDGDLTFMRERFQLVEINDRNVLARAWNKGIRIALDGGARYVIVANLDLVFHPCCIDNLVICAEEFPDAVVWSASRWTDASSFERARLEPCVIQGADWSCFMVDRRLVERVGEFDEGFVPAYLEDEDMVRRIHLAKAETVVSRAALMLHQEAGTIRGLLDVSALEAPSAAAFLKDLRRQITANDDRYLAKWGGRFGTERFTVPFDGKSS